MADLARRGVVSPSLGEATWREASAISRWGMGLAGQVRQAAARDPHRLAVIDADTGESLAYAALVARSDRVSKVLLKAEVGAQDRIGIVARNSLDQLLAILGASGIGAEIIPLHPGISTSQCAT